MRIYNIDFLRGLAALMVLLVHASSSTLPWIEESPLHEVFMFGKYGVQIFFVISGYIITYSLFHSNYSIRNIFKFLGKRLIRINPPAYLIIMLFLLIELITWTVTGNYLILTNPFDPKQLATNFLFLTDAFETDLYIETFWTLEAEMQFYILIALVYPLIISKSSVLRHLLLLGLALLGFLSIPLYLTESIGCFLVGISFFLFQVNYLSKLSFGLFGLLFISIFIFNEQYSEMVFALLGLFVISIKQAIHSSFFQFIGKISYSLYILHVFIFTYLDVILMRLDLDHLHESLETKILIIACYSSIAIVISSLFYHYIERPCINYSKRIQWKS